MSHPTSFSSLPEELQVMVASYTPQHNAAICLRVCQAWRRIFTSFVWRHIETRTSIGRKVDWDTTFFESARSGSLKTHGQWIQSISLRCYPDFIKEFLDLSPETFPRLTSLSFTNPESDSLIASFIRKAPSSAIGNNGSGLKTLEISGLEGFGDFGDSSTDALLEHASTLEVVQLDMMPCMSSKSIQQFLCSAARLKEFSIIGDSRNSDNKDLFLDAHDVVSSDWVCTELEVFGCQIGGIPRPDITQDIAGKPAVDYIKEGTHQESLDLQRGVYSQLGRLTKLKELILGVAVVPRWGDDDIRRQRNRQYDCLAMTVESGLDLLKDLKELENVVMDDMEVYISDDKEEAWVKKNWPKVDRIW
ncbi:hypothetical protein KI688_007536 [Linnemannia hyalina]|uniref:F-box domain-containing protein n=1 Tax=Linnemannia hyalina TaxID=64524 RepID=A0A9P7XJC4_9FUNG|nr:hypothetical protein KI688_007536 [Linnemannia hyalina]